MLCMLNYVFMFNVLFSIYKSVNPTFVCSYTNLGTHMSLCYISTTTWFFYHSNYSKRWTIFNSCSCQCGSCDTALTDSHSTSSLPLATQEQVGQLQILNWLWKWHHDGWIHPSRFMCLLVTKCTSVTFPLSQFTEFLTWSHKLSLLVYTYTVQDCLTCIIILFLVQATAFIFIFICDNTHFSIHGWITVWTFYPFSPCTKISSHWQGQEKICKLQLCSPFSLFPPFIFILSLPPSLPPSCPSSSYSMWKTATS